MLSCGNIRSRCAEKATPLMLRAMYHNERRAVFPEFLIIQLRTATVIEEFQVAR